MATAAVYQIDPTKRNYVGSITIMGSRLNMTYKYDGIATDASITKLDNLYKTRFSLWTNYYTA